MVHLLLYIYEKIRRGLFLLEFCLLFPFFFLILFMTIIRPVLSRSQ